MADVVPFGRYKGKPIAELAADTDYLQWLRQQPWFTEKFAWIDKAIVVVNHGSQEPQETPAHNALQARFLDEKFRCGFLITANPEMPDGLLARLGDVLVSVEIAKQATIKRTGSQSFIDRFTDDLEQELARFNALTAGELETLDYTERYKPMHLREEVKRRAEQANDLACLDVLAAEIASLELGDFLISSDVVFEARGIDVTLTTNCHWHSKTKCSVDLYNPKSYSRMNSPHRILIDDLREFQIEVKPYLGDDYPAVLRQMNANKAHYLLVGDFTSSAIDLDQLRAFFSASKKQIIMLIDVENAVTNLPEWLNKDSV